MIIPETRYCPVVVTAILDQTPFVEIILGVRAILMKLYFL